MVAKATHLRHNNNKVFCHGGDSGKTILVQSIQQITAPPPPPPRPLSPLSKSSLWYSLEQTWVWSPVNYAAI